MKRVTSMVIIGLLLGFSILAAQPRSAELIKDASTISYHMSHPLHEFDAVSKDVTYQVALDPQATAFASVAAQVDVTTFDSGNSNRDSHAMEVIDALTYPQVTFASTSIRQGADSVWVTGKLTFHGVTKEVVIPAAVTWSQNRVDVHGVFQISQTEFKIDRPSLLMIPVADGITFTVATAFRWQ